MNGGIRGHLGWLVAAAAVLIAGPARGDEVTVDGTTLRGVQVVGYSRGEVEIHTSTGEIDRFPLRNVELMVLDSVTGVADFNQAEELLVKQEFEPAMDRYEKAVRAARGFWASMARMRLLTAADGAGNLEKAARAWLDVLAEDEFTAAELIPQTGPADRSAVNRRTLKRLENALDEQTGERRVLIELWHYDLLRRMGDPAAAAEGMKVAQSRLPVGLVSERSLAIKLEALRAEVDAGRYDAAVAALDVLLADAPDAYVPDVLLLKARAQLASAKSEREALRAALPAMRLVIHYPASSLVGEGLLTAAEAHVRSGHPEDAERLLRECLRRGEIPQEARERARARLADLSQPGG